MAVLNRIRTPTTSQAATPATSQAATPATAPTTAAAVKRGAGLGLLLALLATVVWSGSFVTSRGLHDSVPPVQAAFWRWIVALLAVAPFALRETWRQRSLIRHHLGFITLAALLGVTVYNTLVNQAGLDTPAGTMGMIMAASPVVMAGYERLGGQRLGARRIVGMLIACAGVLLLVSKGSLTLGLSVGAFWMIAAALCFGSYSALLRRKPAELGGLAFLFCTFVLGALMLAPVYGVSLAVQGGFEFRTGTVGPLLYVGVFSSAVAFFAWNKAISLIGAARAGVIYYLQPVCVALLSYAVLGERTGPLQILCMALILGGVILGASARTKTAR
ncbi:DMT family transporter [Streptomyces sp. NPDC051561]|uniref:DMT family transporter n=1 Tax=Streptomyces sp. NPDC051561 TaxID=3365658 RepID=UPI00379F789E